MNQAAAAATLRRDLAGLAVLALTAMVLLSLRPPLGSELRYVEAAREMVASGDWIVPHLGYVPYLEKPPLLYWLAASARWCFGDGPVALRLPSILASLVTILLVFRFAWDLRGRRFAWQASLLLLGSAYFSGLASALTTDALFSCWLWLAWYAYWRFDQGSPRWIWGFWLALAGATLSKSPLALIVVAGSVAAYRFIIDASTIMPGRRWLRLLAWPFVVLARAWRPMRILPGLLLVVAINLPWSLLVWRQDPRLLTFLYLRQNFAAFFDGRINHAQPWWYYLGVLAVAFAPFSVVVIPAWAAQARSLWRPLRAALAPTASEAQTLSPEQRARLYLACIAVVSFAFFQCSRSKLGTYLLPIAPALALLAAERLFLVDDGRRHWRRWALPIQATVLVLAAGVMAVAVMWKARLPGRLDAAELPLIAMALGLAITGVALGGVLAARRRLGPGLLATGAGVLLAAIMIGPRLFAIRPDLDSGVLAQPIIDHGSASDLVLVSSSTVQEYAIILRLGRRLGICEYPKELGFGHLVEVLPYASPLPADPYAFDMDAVGNPWLYSPRRLREVWSGAARVWMITETGHRDRLEAAGLAPYLVASAAKRVLLTNHPLTGDPR